MIEGDEYDTAFFEKTAKFLHYRAQVAIVTSVEHDHIDIYPNFQAYRDAFHQFIRSIPKSGLVVANGSDRAVVDLVRDASHCEVAWYALEGEALAEAPPHWMAAPAVSDELGTSFDLFAGGVLAGRARLPLTGKHNILNATAAIAASVQGYGVNVLGAMRALANFRGVKRRQELLGQPDGVWVYDDFAHHPTAVRETLLALRARHPRSKLWAVFEPRSATACRRLHQHEYPRAFDAADEVLLAPLGRSGLPESEALDLGRLVEDLVADGKPAQKAVDIDAIVETLARSVEPGDVVALLSNGAFGGIHAKFLQRLQMRSGATLDAGGQTTIARTQSS